MKQDTNNNSNPLAELMTLAATYRDESPAEESAVLEKLVFQLGRFFMALLPTAPSDTIYILTSLCVTHIGRERLAAAEKSREKGGRA